jgi:hypothetical protein
MKTINLPPPVGLFARILALCLAGLAAAVLLAACGQGGSGDENAEASQREGGSTVFEGLNSGELEVTLDVYRRGEGEGINTRILGTFLKADEGIPLVDMAASARGELNGKEVDYFGALLVGPRRAVLTHEGETYETDVDTFELLKASFEDALWGGSAADVAACLEAVEEIELAQIAGRPTDRGRRTALDGTPLTWVSVDLDVAGVSKALRELTEDPGCGAQLQAAGLLPLRKLDGPNGALAGRVKKAEATLATGKDGIVRELAADVIVDPKGDQGAVEVEFVLRLSEVNEVEKLLPCRGENSLDALFAKLGFNPLQAIEADEAEGLLGLLQGISGTPEAGRPS